MPPSAALVGLLNLPQFMLKPRHQVFGARHTAPFIEDLSLGLNDAPLSGLALSANVIYLLLQGAAVGNLTVQRSIKCLGLALQRGTLGLGVCEFFSQRVVGMTDRLQLVRQGLNDRLQRSNGGRYGFGGCLITTADRLASLSQLLRTSGKYIGGHADFRFEGIIADTPGPLPTPGP
jgi:hypothetical protein